MNTNYQTREEWLTAAVEALRPMFAEAGAELPAVRVSVGWPGGRGNKNAVIGQCWKKMAAADGVAQLFISPKLGEDPVRVLDVLAHELIHAYDDCASGHGAAFGKIARRIGLEGKLTATEAGEDLRIKLSIVALELGDYPHAVLTPELSGIKKQGTRMIKVICDIDADNGDPDPYTLRMTRKWLDQIGAPICPCHEVRMTEV